MDENYALPTLLACDLEQHFKQLVLAYQQRLFAFLYRQSGSSQDAEDILQETFVRAYYALKNYPAHQIAAMKFHAWLIRIALNVLYNQKRGPTLHYTSLDNGEEPLLLEDQAPFPEEQIWQDERRTELASLITGLPEHYATVINLYYFEELSYQEIADLLNQPLGTIKSRLHRAIALLRQRIEVDTTQKHRVG